MTATKERGGLTHRTRISRRWSRGRRRGDWGWMQGHRRALTKALSERHACADRLAYLNAGPGRTVSSAGQYDCGGWRAGDEVENDLAAGSNVERRENVGDGRAARKGRKGQTTATVAGRRESVQSHSVILFRLLAGRPRPPSRHPQAL